MVQSGKAFVLKDSMDRPCSNITYGTCWCDMMVSMWSPAICPSMCRKVSVHEIRPHSRVKGSKVIVMVMGRSV